MLLDNSKNPYRGLQAFEEEHSKMFFGRQALTEKLYQQVCQHPLTVVMGASGTGKSSVVKAGLIPHIKKLVPRDSLEMLFGKSLRKQWYIIAPIRPGESPLKNFNTALAAGQLLSSAEERIETISVCIGNWFHEHPQSKILLVIERAEELFTICGDRQARKDFLNLLTDLVSDHGEKLRLVMTLRSDFESQFKDTGLQEYWHEARFIVPRMTREELRSCIEKPASARSIGFESPSLVEKLIDEVIKTSEGLPLLSFTLDELYIKSLKAVKQGTRRKRVITQADYQQIGGLTQSLNRRADSEYEALVKIDPEYELTIRNVMVRMLAISGGKLARRRIYLSELEYPEPEKSRVKEIIRRFTEAKLLVKGKDDEGNFYLEPTHDAVVQGWQKLLQWKEDEKETIALQRWLRPAVFKWKNQRDQSLLWNTHPLLDSLKKILNSDNNWLNPAETDFVRRSIRRKNQKKALRGVFAFGGSVLAAGTVFSIGISQDDKLMAQACKLVGDYLQPNSSPQEGGKSGENSFTYPHICKDVPILVGSPVASAPSSSASSSTKSSSPQVSPSPSATKSPISVLPSPTASPSPTISPTSLVSPSPSPQESPISALPSPVTSPSPTESPTSLTSPAPASSTSPKSKIPSTIASRLSAKKFLPSLEVTPKDYYTRGNDRRDTKSIENSTKIINNPNTSNLKRKNAYINRGVVYFRHKKYQEAIADYSKVIKDHNSQTDIAPTKSQLINAYVNRGIAYSSLQEPKHQLAVEDYNRAIAIKSDYADAYINRGIAYSGLGQYEMAVKDYIKAISITPENADIYYAKAHTQSLMEGKTKRAMYNYQRAADLYKKQGKSSYSKNALQKIEELKASLDT